MAIQSPALLAWRSAPVIRAFVPRDAVVVVLPAARPTEPDPSLPATFPARIPASLEFRPAAVNPILSTLFKRDGEEEERLRDGERRLSDVEEGGFKPLDRDAAEDRVALDARPPNRDMVFYLYRHTLFTSGTGRQVGGTSGNRKRRVQNRHHSRTFARLWLHT